MGATAGTGMGVQRFAEGGSTSSGVNVAASNPAAQRAAQLAASDAFALRNMGGIFSGNIPQPPQFDPYSLGASAFTQPQMPAIYRPNYEDYGIASIPTRQGYLSSLLNSGDFFTPTLPTFTRSSVNRGASYNIPISGTPAPTIPAAPPPPSETTSYPVPISGGPGSAMPATGGLVSHNPWDYMS